MGVVYKASRADEPIAGRHGGKFVNCAPDMRPVYDSLVTLANQGQHWARLTVEGIQSLKSGRTHQNNIFVKKNHLVQGGYEEFTMILPGCKATVEKRPDDTFMVVDLEPDLNYFQLQLGAERPGLYEAKQTGQRRIWTATLKENGKIKNEKDRLVAISERKYEEVSDAAEENADSLAAAPFSGGNQRVNQNGFDLHYTPGTKKIGGLINYKEATRPLDNESLHESAYLLAQTMYDARNIKGVGWVAEYGGSGVLTQAMKMLADRNVTLENHTVFLYRPRTSPNEAYKLAEKLKLNIPSEFSKRGLLDYMGNRDQFELIGNRLRHGKEYHAGHATKDLYQLGTSLHGGGAILATVGSALATQAGVTTGQISVSALMAAHPALVVFFGAVVAAKPVAKLGNQLVEQALPDRHRQIKRKLGW